MNNITRYMLIPLSEYTNFTIKRHRINNSMKFFLFKSQKKALEMLSWLNIEKQWFVMIQVSIENKIFNLVLEGKLKRKSLLLKSIHFTGHIFLFKINKADNTIKHLLVDISSREDKKRFSIYLDKYLNELEIKFQKPTLSNILKNVFSIFT